MVLAENGCTLKESEEFPRNHLQRYGLRKPRERVHSPRASKVEEQLPHRGSKEKRERAIPRTRGEGIAEGFLTGAVGFDEEHSQPAVTWLGDGQRINT